MCYTDVTRAPWIQPPWSHLLDRTIPAGIMQFREVRPGWLDPRRTSYIQLCNMCYSVASLTSLSCIVAREVSEATEHCGTAKTRVSAVPQCSGASLTSGVAGSKAHGLYSIVQHVLHKCNTRALGPATPVAPPGSHYSGRNNAIPGGATGVAGSKADVLHNIAHVTFNCVTCVTHVQHVRLGSNHPGRPSWTALFRPE